MRDAINITEVPITMNGVKYEILGTYLTVNHTIYIKLREHGKLATMNCLLTDFVPFMESHKIEIKPDPFIGHR